METDFKKKPVGMYPCGVCAHPVDGGLSGLRPVMRAAATSLFFGVEIA